VESGFTGVSLAAADTQEDARNAALTASAVCQMELGLEIVPLGGARAAAELARQLRSRGAPPSAVRITGMEDDAESLSAELGDTALSTATESVALELPRRPLRQLVASGPFLRALQKAVAQETWDVLQAWADEKGATVDQSAARHQRLLRDLPPDAQERLEALCCFEALELFSRAGARGTSARLIAAVAALHQETIEDRRRRRARPPAAGRARGRHAADGGSRPPEPVRRARAEDGRASPSSTCTRGRARWRSRPSPAAPRAPCWSRTTRGPAA